MRNGYIKLDASPPLEMPSSYCGACGIEVGEGAYGMVYPFLAHPDPPQEPSHFHDHRARG